MKTQKHRVRILFLFILIQKNFFAQELTQTIRGVVVDKVSQSPVPGAIIQVIATGSLQFSAMSETDGKFSISKVPVGKQSLKISMMGYKEAVLQNLTLNSGKELVLTIQIEEDITQISEVDVVAKIDKTKALNDMSTVSTRAFSVEETQKFAAAANDPGRMALAFAGVVAAGDGNNHISIRGNSPNGLQWRMEGVEIPNPNHFANVGTSGGGISILSSQLLNNSDFSTGAFAAEYGNALSGVFDLKLRKGNNHKREYTFQAGVLGFDLAAEGPFKKGYDGSYLINYRYSTLSVLGKMGVELGDGVTNFQDLSFNVFLPTKKLGNFSVFGFGGLSDQTTQAKRDSLLWKEDEFKRYDARFYSNTGAAGLTHTKLIGNRSYLRTALVLSDVRNGYVEKKLQSDYQNFVKEYEQEFSQNRLMLSSVYTRKISARTSIRTGLILARPGYNLGMSSPDQSGQLIERIKVKGNTETAQGFFQGSVQLTEKLSVNAGLHYMHLFLNNTKSLEPRMAAKLAANNKNIFTAGYGLHSQLQPIGVYFAKEQLASDGFRTPNKNLRLSKAHHFVLGYDRSLNAHTHIKTELYYQHLFDIPVSVDRSNTFSMLNVLDGYNTSPLENTGLGRNYGIELTCERFLFKDLYYLVSGSLYESKFRASNGNWYNTRFNTNFQLAVTAGKEWTLSGRKSRVLGFNFKSLYVGGFRYTPIKLEESVAAGETKFDNERTYALQNPAYYRLDLRISLKRNYEKLTSTFALDIQNATNRKNVGGQYFDAKTASIKYWYQAPLLPILSYRLEF